MRSLRAREFAAITLAVVASVGVTLILAVALVRESVRDDDLESLAHQASLIATQQQASRGSGPMPGLGRFFTTQQERLAILSLSQAALLLPGVGAQALRDGRPASGSVTIGRASYLYAAVPERRQAIVVLRSGVLGDSDLQPYTIAFAIAAAVGAVIAAIAAFLLARAVSRPIERVSAASLALAAGERPGPLPLVGSTEVAVLAASFNKLAADLDRARDAERAFLLSVSHELKTPLAVIRGHGEALLDGVLPVSKAAAIVVQESERLDRLIRDLLDMARLSQRSFSASPEPVDLAVLAADALRRHEPDSRRVGVSLLLKADASAPALADPGRTLQLLSNLVENALRSTRAGGSVTLTAAPGLLQVADTGPGLAADELPRAFERFFLYGRYVQNRAVGTGLGLAIVKELSEAMAGTVSVESTVGVGTTFTVRLPTPL